MKYSLLVKALPIKIANQSGYYFSNGRWHKFSGKPAPKGSPISHHPEAGGVFAPAKHLTDAQWESKKLKADNVNAKTINPKLDKLKEMSESGNITGILGLNYGSNNYEAAVVKFANELLALHGSPHTVSKSQKAGEHPVVAAPSVIVAPVESVLTPDLVTSHSLLAHCSAANHANLSSDTPNPELKNISDAMQQMYVHGENGLGAYTKTGDSITSAISLEKPSTSGAVKVLFFGSVADDGGASVIKQVVESAKKKGVKSIAAKPTDNGQYGAFFDAGFVDGGKGVLKLDLSGEAKSPSPVNVAVLEELATSDESPPQEGDTKEGVNGDELVFHNGRWHSTDLPPPVGAVSSVPSNTYGFKDYNHSLVAAQWKSFAEKGDFDSAKTSIGKLAQTMKDKPSLQNDKDWLELMNYGVVLSKWMNEKTKDYLSSTVASASPMPVKPLLGGVSAMSSAADAWSQFATDGDVPSLSAAIHGFTMVMHKDKKIKANKESHTLLAYGHELIKWAMEQEEAREATAPIPAPVIAPVTKPVVAPRPTVAATDSPPPASDYYVLSNTEDGSDKFWKIAVVGSKTYKSWGKNGTKGTSLIGDFDSPAEAQENANKQIKEKIKKGYDYNQIPATPAVAETTPKEGDTKQGVGGMLVFHNGHWVLMDEVSPDDDDEMDGVNYSDDTKIIKVDHWDKVGGQLGSNFGMKLDDENGDLWYCKFPDDEMHSRSEFLASKLYAAAGVAGQDTRLVSRGGKVGLASRWVNVSTAGAAGLKKTSGALSGFAVDAWLANWDVVGMSNDNLQIDSTGHAVRVDAGGSLGYRAQGGKKAFTANVQEIDSMRDKAINPAAAAVFGDMSAADIAASVSKVLAISDADITEMVNTYGGGSVVDKKSLAAILIARKNDLAAKYPSAVKKPKPKVDLANLPMGGVTLPESHNFLNWEGGGGLSGSSAINQANTETESDIKKMGLQGNLTALHSAMFSPINKNTGLPSDTKQPMSEHPSKHVVQYYSDVSGILEDVASPPADLVSMSAVGVASIAELDAKFKPKAFGTTVSSVSSSEKLGFWVYLGAIKNPSKFRPKTIKSFTSTAIAAAFSKFKKASELSRHFVRRVQASGSYNDLFRNGMKKDYQGNNLKDVAKAALALSSEQPEGTTIYRWQNMTDSMIKKLKGVPDGTIFQATGPMCTSFKPDATHGFGKHRLVIKYAKGARAVDSFGSGNPSYEDEFEVTTLPNARFVILGQKMVKDEHKGGERMEIELLMLPPDLGL